MSPSAERRSPGRPDLADAVLCAACALVALLYVTVALNPGPIPRHVAVTQMLLALGLTAASLFWRARPRAAGVAVAALLAAWATTFWLALPIHTGLTPYLVLAGFVVYAWTRWAGRAWEAAAAALGGLGSVASPGNALPTSEGVIFDAASVLVHLLMLGFVWLLARHHRGRDEAACRDATAARERHEAQAREQAQRAEHAVQTERERIASEIHDILAHSLTLIHARSTAGLLAGTDEPREALGALTDVRKSASSALADVRTLVGTLKRTPSVAPVGDVRDVPAVLDRFRAAGLLIDADVPSPEDLAEVQGDGPLLVRLAVLRILEEGLTNALRHGDVSSPVHVRLHLDTAATVRIENALRIPRPDDERVGTGTGLTSLATRVGDLGGTLTTGPTGPVGAPATPVSSAEREGRSARSGAPAFVLKARLPLDHDDGEAGSR